MTPEAYSENQVFPMRRAAFQTLLGLGVLLIAGAVAVAVISGSFAYGSWIIEADTYRYIGLAMALGLVCAGLVFVVPRMTPGAKRSALGVIFVAGLIARLIMFASTPVLEDDWHRYLWDGATVANGIDPYKYSPADAAPSDYSGEQRAWSENEDLARLQKLTLDSENVHRRINYPHFKTIYPPIAQGGFALASVMAPFSLNGWRAVLLVVDLISFALIAYALSLYGRSVLWVGLYWWNPVVLLEAFNAGHMDILIVPFLAGALALSRLGKLSLAVVALAGAAAVKFWPVILAPALVRPVLFKPLRLVGLALLFCAVTLLLVWPQLRYVFTDPDQGLVAYSETWRRHAFIFSVMVEGIFSGFADPDRVSRLLVATSVGLGALWFAWRLPADGEKLPGAMMAATLVLLFMSPTGYPWYQIWIAAFIPFVPRLGAFALMLAAPLYYLRFLLGDTDPIYQWVIVPIAFGVPLIAFCASSFLNRSQNHA